MADVEIKFRTVAELAGARELEKSLEKQITQAKALGKDFSGLEKDLLKVKSAIGQSGLAGGLKDVASQVPGVGRLVSTFQALVSPIGIAAAALSGFFAAMARGLTEFAKTEQAAIGLDAALAQNGLLTKSYREELQALSTELQNATAIGDKEWLDVLTRLSQFGSNPKTIGVDIEAVKNLAGLMNGDLKAAANAYSRALQGQFEMFGRLGIRVDETLDPMEKLEQLQRQLAERGGGQLEARAQSLSGKFTTLRNSVDDTLKVFGRFVANTGYIQGGLGLVTGALDLFAEAFGGPVAKLESMGNKLSHVAGEGFSAAQATREHAEALKSLNEQASAANAALTREIQLIGESERAQLDLLRKRKELALAQAEAQGGTKEEISRRKGAIEGSFAAAEANVQGKSDAARLKALSESEEGERMRALEAAREAEQDKALADRVEEYDRANRAAQQTLNDLQEATDEFGRIRAAVARGLGLPADSVGAATASRLGGDRAQFLDRAIPTLERQQREQFARADAARAGLPSSFPGPADARRLAEQSAANAGTVLTGSAAAINAIEESRDRITRGGAVRREGAGIDAQRREVERGAEQSKLLEEAARKAEEDKRKRDAAIGKLIEASSGLPADVIAVLQSQAAEIDRQRNEMRQLNARQQNAWSGGRGG